MEPAAQSASAAKPAAIPAGISEASALPAVTVVIVTGGDLDQLDRGLDALVRQDLQAAYDIIVVDNNPAPATARMVALWAARSLCGPQREHGSQHAAYLRYMPHETGHGNEAAARNLGWRAARSAIVAFTADDTVAAVDWLRQGMAEFTASPLDAAFGRVNASLPRHATESQLRAHQRESGEFAGCNWFVTRAVLERLQGFDERFFDAASIDTDMHFRLLEAQLRWRPAPAARVAHPLPAEGWNASLAALRALRSDALLAKKHPQLYRQNIHQTSLWHDLAVVASLLLAAFGLWLGQELLAVAASGVWLVMTGMLCIRRLRDTSKTAAHVAFVLLTSLVMPPVSLYWRLLGAWSARGRHHSTSPA